MASPTDMKALFKPIMGFMGQKGGESAVESLETPTSPVKKKQVEKDHSTDNVSAQISYGEEASKDVNKAEEKKDSSGPSEAIPSEDKAVADQSEAEVVSPSIPVEPSEQEPVQVEGTESANDLPDKERFEEALPTLSELVQPESTS